MRRVDAFDIEARIGFRVPQHLGLGQNLVEFPARLLHGRQDIIAGAIQDAVDTVDPIPGKSFTQRLHDGNPARDARLVGETYTDLLRLPREARPMDRHHGLVGGDYALVRGDRGFDDVKRHPIGTADEFDDDIDLVVRSKFPRILEPSCPEEIDPAVPLTVPGRKPR